MKAEGLDLQVLEVGSSLRVAFGGHVLAELGADVVRVEVPGGDPDRTAGGWRRARFELLHRGKQCIAGPLSGDEVAALVDRADVLLDDGGPPLGEVPVRVSAAGLADGGGSTLRAGAHSGAAWRSGTPEGEPLSLPYGFGETQTGLHVAAAALAGTLDRRLGRSTGGHYQVAEEDVFHTIVGIYDLFNSFYSRKPDRGAGLGSDAISKLILTVFGDARDGAVLLQVNTVEQLARLRSVLGGDAESKYATYRDALKHRDEFASDVRAWMAKRSLDELLDDAAQFGVVLTPVASIDDVLDRFQPDMMVDAPEESDLDRWPLVPWIGKGRSQDAPPPLSAPTSIQWGNRDRETPTPVQGAIIEFGWNWTGPMIGSYMADLGYDVIRIESATRLDPMRRLPPPRVNREAVTGDPKELNPYYRQLNAGKASVVVNIKHPAGRDLVLELAKTSAAVVENLASGTLSRSGLSPEAFHEANPDLTYLSLPVLHSSHPLSSLRGYAPVFTSLGGLEALAGYSDGSISSVLTLGLGDPNGGIHGVVTLLASLLSGGGRTIEISQTRAITWQLIEPMARYLSSGEVAAPQGNQRSSSLMVCVSRTGDGLWMAIEIDTEPQFEQLCAIVGRPDLCQSEPLTVEAQAEISHAVSRWMETVELAQVRLSLEAAAVPVFEVLSPERSEDYFARKGLTEPWQPDGFPPLRRYRIPWRVDGRYLERRWSDTTLGWATEDVVTSVLGKERVEELMTGDVLT